MLDPGDYTVGWICAINTEYVAAQACLDDRHDGPESLPSTDNNNYTLGRIGKHNVVIAELPDGEYGTSSAAAVARDMLHSFPSVRIGLMVGIGGGAPSADQDVRLGDIVVSAPRDGNSGVFQYDFGKTIQGKSFHRTGFLNQPPAVLRAAVNGLKAEYKLHGHQIEQAISDILEKLPRLRKEYKRPDSTSDRLYRSDVVHPSDTKASCMAVCGDEPSKLVRRPGRTEDEDNPTIHYGLIASANNLMKDASVRDKLVAERGVLCFEMEAAGLMNTFPCLVVRGICDYSDSHKNKEWQGYAAMAAAAYAKDLLHQITPKKVEAEKKIGDMLSGLQRVVEKQRDIAGEHLGIAKEQLQSQKDLAREKLTLEEQKCHQLFRLTTNTADATYEWYKDRVEDRVDGTCQWFLQHDNFQTWLNQDSGPLLVSADPGCGKSVLAKYLVDHGLPRSSTICYFFFKEQDQNKVRQALCALLHQLFSQKPSLIDYAMPQFRKNGQGLINSTQSLWSVLGNAVKDPQAGPVILVIDALDECAEPDFENLVRNLKSQLSKQMGYGKLKYLLTCRPYEQIMSKFRSLIRDFPNIHIPGEEESETISQEVNLVIAKRVNQLSEQKNLSPDIKSHLEKGLKKTTHRTYLWVFLVFDTLEKEDFKKTIKGVQATIATLPKDINEAYEKILNKSKEDPMVQKAMSIILAASRPLTIAEMNVAVNVSCTSETIHDLDLEEEEDFKSRLRSWCGLFISIYHGKIYFLHQTAREFLLADSVSPTTIPSGLRWHHSISTQQAHAVLAELCVFYLNFFNSDSLLRDMDREVSHSVNTHAFLDYSAKTWGAHFREADITNNAAIIPCARRICDPDSKSYSVWFKIYCETIHMETTDNFTDLMVASNLGLRAVVSLLLENGADVKSKHSRYGWTALHLAARNGHEAVVQLLLEKKADVEVKDSSGCTALHLAAQNGHEAVVSSLIDWHANVNAQGAYGTALHSAARNGEEKVAHLLLERGADANLVHGIEGSAMHIAASRGFEPMVRTLMKSGANLDLLDGDGWTPLACAWFHRQNGAFELLSKKSTSAHSFDRPRTD
ncbi:Ankyrin repeat protein [Metarhizium guizhouense ARSEF 977]|uniref:Ankyrin repeat protein n=1 Tax=Metarhizium guizhouense (strain ARSEF 977) TaxID=1276136 RepID=A0A0B4GKY1_METGA|nr:Ankyrin repeat protein [Metarhizium guizhouense ARSEF 977]